MATWHLTIDCREPSRLVPFWALALGYEVQPPPEGFDTWKDWYRSVGVPESELEGDGDAVDRIFDPTGSGPPIWFQIVPEGKTVKNRLHIDVMVGGGRTVPVELRKERVDAKVAQLIAAGASVYKRNPDDFDDAGPDSYAMVMHDPEGNEFCVA